VSGGTASGKTSLCKVIVSQINDTSSVLVLALDSFYKNAKDMDGADDMGEMERG
jgi:uridine kinase